MLRQKEDHLLLDCGWPGVAETVESKTADKGGLLVHTQREDSHVKMEAEIGVRLPQATVSQGLAATTRSWEEARKEPSLEPPERAWTGRHLDFWTPGLKNYERINFCYWSHQVCVALLWQLWKSNKPSVYSLVKCLFMSFGHLKIGLFVFLLFIVLFNTLPWDSRETCTSKLVFNTIKFSFTYKFPVVS